MAQFMKVVIEQLRRNNWTMVEMAIVNHVWLGDGADMIRMGPPYLGMMANVYFLATDQ